MIQQMQGSSADALGNTPKAWKCIRYDENTGDCEEFYFPARYREDITSLVTSEGIYLLPIRPVTIEEILGETISGLVLDEYHGESLEEAVLRKISDEIGKSLNGDIASLAGNILRRSGVFTPKRCKKKGKGTEK